MALVINDMFPVIYDARNHRGRREMSNFAEEWSNFHLWQKAIVNHCVINQPASLIASGKPGMPVFVSECVFKFARDTQVRQVAGRHERI